MTRFGWLVLGIVFLVIASAIGGWFLISTKFSVPTPAPLATSTTPDLSGSSIYTNGEFGFAVVYPATDTITETFSPWRVNAIATGTPLLAVTESGGIVRIGASANAKELKTCITVGSSEKTLPDMRLGSTTFKVFVHDQLGTENQTRITSYRTMHEGSCMAIELFQPMANGTVATSTSLMAIITSFSFARP